MMIIYILTCICLTSKQLPVMSVTSDHFAKNTEFSGQACAVYETTFMEYGVGSKLMCAYKCTVTEDCASIFYSGDTSICQGCKLAYSANLTSILTGSEYFERIKTGYKYIGCFGDCRNGVSCSVSSRVMKHELRNETMTLEMCYEHCLAFDLPYFGTEMAIACYCGDEDFDRDGEVSRCTMSCAGNSSHECGGSRALSVYKYTYGS